MAGVQSLKDLIAWQRGMSMCVQVYRFSATFPEHERFGLQAQIRRAAVSVPSNIAEGFGRQNPTDMSRFLRIARGSLFEVRTHIELAHQLGYSAHEQAPDDIVDETDRVLQGLIRSLAQRSQ